MLYNDIMKKFALLFLFLISFWFFTQINAQNTEFNLKFNSGLFSFSGKSATGISFINVGKFHNFTNNPYGSKGGLSFGFSVNLSRITKKHHIFAIDLGYEVLRSRTDITEIFLNNESSSQKLKADGKTYLNNGFINLYLSTGHRFTLSKFNFDLTGGLDFAYHLSSIEKGKASTETTEYTTKIERHTIGMEFRPRLQLEIFKKRTGIYIGYSKGLKNYLADMTCGTHISYGNIFRFGIKYRFK